MPGDEAIQWIQRMAYACDVYSVLSVIKTTTQAEARTGENVSYRIVVSNNGTRNSKAVKILETSPGNAAAADKQDPPETRISGGSCLFPY